MKKVEQISQWLHWKDLKQGFSTKHLGNLSFRTGNKEAARERRKIFSERLGFSWENAIIPPLTHSNNVALISDNSSISTDKDGLYLKGGKVISTKEQIRTVHNSAKWQAGIDGIIVTVPKIFLVFLTADCASLAFYHPESRVFAMGHVGLIGAINQLPRKLVQSLHEFCGCNPNQIEVVIFPSIRACHYDLTQSGAWNVIKKNVYSYYGKSEFYSNGHFNLQGFVKWQLLEMGVRSESIFDTNLCTVCNYRDFYSNYRAKTPARKLREGRFASTIGREE